MKTAGLVSVAKAIGGAAALAALAAGCETINGGSRRGAVSEQQIQAARANAERQQQEREQAFMRTRVEETSASLDSIEARLGRLERQSHENDAIRGEIDQLRSEIDGLRADQQRMRREIVDDLSAEIAKAIAASTPAAPRRGSSGRSGGASTATGSGYEHVVEAGQTLSAIASAYGTTVDKIMKANGIKDANKVRVGQTLFIPD